MGERTIETRVCSIMLGPLALLVPQRTAHAGQTASVMDAMAVSAAPAPAKAVRETGAIVIPPSATVPTRKRPAASEKTSPFSNREHFARTVSAF